MISLASLTLKFLSSRQILMIRQLETSAVLCRKTALDRREMLRSVGKVDEGTEGEKYFRLDRRLLEGRFPTPETHSEKFDGIPYAEIPICSINCTKNNTLIAVTDYKGVTICNSSCGVEGFKNAKKGTNVAGQAVGISAGMKAIRKGVKTVRVAFRGLGPGRMASIKGLQMAGLNIISVTDRTNLPEVGPRPRKARKL